MTSTGTKISRPKTATAADDAARLSAAWEQQAASRRRETAIQEKCSDMVVVADDFKGW
jgi:hypothetical protein